MENVQDIHNRMLENINPEYDKSKGSFFYDATKPAAIEFLNAYSKIEDTKTKLYIENLEGKELERFINQRTGMTRKPATKASTIVTINGVEGANIKKGDLVSSDTVKFISLEDKVIDSTGVMNVLVECEECGTIGNLPVGAIKYFPMSIAGLTGVTNIEAINNGYDAETDYDLLKRYYEKIRTPATSGNKYHYINWAKEVIGVGDVKVFPLWNGDNTVKLIIIDSNKQPANSELVERVQNYIDPGVTGLGEGQAPIGAFCTVVSATSKSINISVTIIKDENYLVEQIKTNIENSITEYLKDLAFNKSINYVSYAIIGNQILNSEGVIDYSNLIINDGTSNIIIGDEEVAVLGLVTLNE